MRCITGCASSGRRSRTGRRPPRRSTTAVKRWQALTRFLADGELPIDNNWVENQIRPIAIGRNNCLFAGSLRAGKRAAAVMSLLHSARINGLDPYAYIRDVLERLAAFGCGGLERSASRHRALSTAGTRRHALTATSRGNRDSACTRAGDDRSPRHRSSVARSFLCSRQDDGRGGACGRRRDARCRGGSVETGRVAEQIDARVVKVTLRLDGVHAGWLARRARSADVSQGAYVMGLLDGEPLGPRSADHGAAVAGLADSTHKVAAMSADIHGFLRLIRNAKGDEAAEKYRAGLMSISKDMRAHLEVASRLMLELSSQQRMRLHPGARRRERVPR
jgi:hypothetical protein